MMTAQDFYRIISSIVPLYIFMFMGYGSVKWWNFFNQEQCSGISRFCSLFTVPMLSFYYITKTNLDQMNLKLFGADVLQKVIVIVVLACWCKLAPGGSIERVITIFSICTLPNILILGLRFIKSMYLAKSTPLVVEILLAQSVIWHPLLLIMYEYRAARILISQQFGEAQGHDVDIETTSADSQRVVDTRAREVEAIHKADEGGSEGKDLVTRIHLEGHESGRNRPPAKNEHGEIKEVPSISTTEVVPQTEYQHMSNKPTSILSTTVMTKQIMTMVWKKLIGNPNTYATILGLVCAFALSKFQLIMPLIVTNSVTFLSNAGLGIGMFNMGLSMGLQPTLIPCGKMVATLTMVLRFIVGPIVMVFASLIVGLRGTVFCVAVVQAAISQGVMPSVFAVEYNIYPEIFTVGTTLGMVITLPVTFLYYNVLGN